MKKIKLLIVDDRDIVRDSLKLLFSNSLNITVKDEASDGGEALGLIEKNDYDVVLMDVNMPTMNGVDATKNILKLKPQVRILASSFNESASYISEMIKAGAYGFIKKGESRKSYFDAIESVNSGKIYLSEEVNYKTYDKVSSFLKASY